MFQIQPLCSSDRTEVLKGLIIRSDLTDSLIKIERALVFLKKYKCRSDFYNFFGFSTFKQVYQWNQNCGKASVNSK